MPTWSTACLDWKARIRDRRSLIPFSPLFPASAEAKMAVFTSLRIPDLPGQPTIGKVCERWILDYAAAIFGAYDAETGEQHITGSLLLVSKKNTKSTVAAAIMLTELICGWREYDENLILAPTIEVAGNAFKPAAAMVRADPELDALLHIQDHYRLITHRNTKATLKVVAAVNRTVAGKKASRVLVDELWLFGPMPEADAMLGEATGGQIGRPEGYTLFLTTQSDKEPAGVFKEKLAYARDVRDGIVVDPTFLPVLYEFPPEMIEAEAYLEPANFYITNPNLGRSVRQEWIERKLGEAMAAGAGAKQTFLAKHLNVEIGLRLRTDRWAGAEFWQRRAVPLTLDDLIARCEVIIVGLDGGGLDDLYGMTVLGRETATISAEVDDQPEASDDTGDGAISIKRWLSWSHAWAHRIVLDLRKSIAGRLRDFDEAGELTILDDDAIDASGLPADIAQILRIVVRIRDAGLLCCVVVDPAGLGELVDALAGEQIREENDATGRNYLIGAKQGIAMMNALKTAERKLANGTLVHADQAMMDWCVGNLKIETLATAIRATKQNAGDAKIDPAMALFNAVTMMATNPDACRSLYEERGLLIL